MNKKAFQLSINFVVILIISITVFIFGISFLSKLFTGAEKISEDYYQKFDKQVEDLMCSGLERVCIPKDRVVVDRNNVAVFGVGILNVLGSTKNFRILVSHDSAYTKGGTPITCSNCDDWPIYTTNSLEIKNNEQENHAIVMATSSTLSGIYIFDLVVCYDDGVGGYDSECNLPYFPDNYDTIHKLYVEVP